MGSGRRYTSVRATASTASSPVPKRARRSHSVRLVAVSRNWTALAVSGNSTARRISNRAEAKRGARLALALGGGAARGLAHIGVLETFEREGIRPDFIAGSSMGGLIGALSASGLASREIEDVARGFHFPRWFIPGGILRWTALFGSVSSILSGTFERLATSLAVTATDLEAGTQVILHTGPVLPAVRATCAVPGFLPPVKIGGRWLIDGGLVNLIPVDVAWMAEPDIVVAVSVGAPRHRPVPQLDWRVTTLLSRLGVIVPNPATAKITLEMLVRAAEIVLARQTALAAAMIEPEVLIEPELGDIGLRDFDRLQGAVEAGRRAAELALPKILRLLESPPSTPEPAKRVLSLRFDPVCGMVISPTRARAQVDHGEATYYFCSANCRERFERDPDDYLGRPVLRFSGTGPAAGTRPRGRPPRGDP